MRVTRLVLSGFEDKDSLIWEGICQTGGNETTCGSAAYDDVVVGHDENCRVC